MILDCHMHLEQEADRDDFLKRLEQAGVAGGFVFSEPGGEGARPTEQRVEHVLSICEGNDHLYPFLFIDPLDKDAPDQVRMAVDAGIKGFKIICGIHSVSDERCLTTTVVYAATTWNGRKNGFPAIKAS